MHSPALLVGNWKMNLGVQASRALAAKLLPLSTKLKKSEIWIAPSSESLSAVSAELKGKAIMLGAQNCHWEKSGAFTGETSTTTLQELGCSFVIVGHSERRHQFHEDSQMVAKRCHAALNAGLTTILCVGETLAEREAGNTYKILEAQLQACLTGLGTSVTKLLVLAYEPVWAIGTGKVAEPKVIDEAHAFIRSKLPSSSIPILYGGSVTAENLASFLPLENANGALIGGASVSFEKFAALIEVAEKI